MGFWDSILSVFSTVIPAVVQWISGKETNETNKEIAENTNQTQIDIHNQDNAFNASEAQKTREFNSVGSQLQRGRNAGVPDWMTLGQPSTVASQASSSAPPSLVVPQLSNPLAGLAGSIGSSLSGGIRDLAEAGKAGADKQRVLKTLGLELANLDADLQTKQILNGFELTYGGAMRAAQLKVHYATIKNLTNQAEMFASEGRLNDANTVLIKLRQFTEKQNARLTGYKADIAKQESDSYAAVVEANIRKLASEANANNSMAALNRENANRIHELLPGEKNRQVVEQSFMKAETSATWEQISKSAVERSKLAREMAILSLQAQNMTLEANQIKMYQERYEEILENAIEMDKRTNNQLRQDYHNIFKYVGSLLGGTGAAAVTQAGQVKPGPVQVSGFRP